MFDCRERDPEPVTSRFLFTSPNKDTPTLLSNEPRLIFPKKKKKFLFIRLVLSGEIDPEARSLLFGGEPETVEDGITAV